MTPEERHIIQSIGLINCDRGLIGWSVTLLAYGFFAPLFIMVIHPLLQKQGKTPLSWAMLVATVLNFLSVTAILATAVLSPIQQVNVLLDSYGTLRDTANHYNDAIEGLNVASTWLQILPPVFNDGVIIWRAWAISGRRRRVLYVSIVSWTCSLGLTICTLVYQSIQSIELSRKIITDKVLIGLLTSSYISSLAINVAGTGLVAHTLWTNLQSLRGIMKHRHHFHAWRILLLLVESGAAYAVLQLVFIILAWVPPTREVNSIASGTFSSFYFVFSAVYPALTISIVSGPFSMDRVQKSVVDVQTISEAAQSV